MRAILPHRGGQEDSARGSVDIAREPGAAGRLSFFEVSGAEDSSLDGAVVRAVTTLD